MPIFHKQRGFLFSRIIARPGLRPFELMSHSIMDFLGLYFLQLALIGKLNRHFVCDPVWLNLNECVFYVRVDGWIGWIERMVAAAPL